MSGASTTFRSARFLAPDYLVRGRDNVISCPLWSAGALVAPLVGGSSVSVYDSSSAAIVSSAVISVVGNIATYTVGAAALPSTLTLGMGWRVEWTLSVAGVVTVYRNSGGLCRSHLAPVVTDADLFRRVSGLDPSGSAPLSSVSDYQSYIDEAWLSILGRLVGAGSLPHLVMEPHALREPHILLALSLIFEDFRTRLNETYAEQAREYRERYDRAWSGLALLYDESDDGTAASARRRATSPTIWLTGRA